MHSRPAISHTGLPAESSTDPLISKASLPRHERGLNVKVQVSPVRWLASVSHIRIQHRTDDEITIVIYDW